MGKEKGEKKVGVTRKGGGKEKERRRKGEREEGRRKGGGRKEEKRKGKREEKRRVGWSCFLGKNSIIKVKVRQGPWLGGRSILL